MDRIERMILRSMAWERAKGELRSMLTTHDLGNKNYDDLKNEINKFIDDVENNSLYE